MQNCPDCGGELAYGETACGYRSPFSYALLPPLPEPTPFHLAHMFLNAQQTWDHDHYATVAQLNLAMDLFMLVSDAVYQLSGSPNL